MKVISLFKNENNLIAQAVRKDRRAQKKLYERHSGKMLAVCRRYIKDVHQAEEVMLNGFLKVFSNLKSFKNEGSFEGWVRRIMVRESISFLRTRKRIDFSEEIPSIEPHIINAIDSEIEVAHIMKLIDSLPEGYKIVFVMYAIEGYKHKEIAEMLKISIGTSKSQLFKARQMLQEQLKTTKTADYGTT